MAPASTQVAEFANGYPQGRDRWAQAVALCDDRTVGPRFLTLADVAETLNISAAQTYALVRRGDLPAIKVGGRGQWRVEAAALEEYIERQYLHTREYVRTHPFGVGEVPADD